MRAVPGPLWRDEPPLVAERNPVMAGEGVHRLASNPSPTTPEAHQVTRTRFKNRLCWHAAARKRRMSNQDSDAPFNFVTRICQW